MKRITLITAVALAVAAAGLGAGEAKAATAATAQQATVVNLTPSRIASFTWVRGQLGWRAGSISRLGRTVFSLDSAGRFAMFQPDGYPALRGTWRANGSTISFSARHSFSTGFTGTNGTDVQGTINARTGQVQLLYVAGTTLAAFVGGQSFGLNNVKVFRAQLQLRRV